MGKNGRRRRRACGCPEHQRSDWGGVAGSEFPFWHSAIDLGFKLGDWYLRWGCMRVCACLQVVVQGKKIELDYRIRLVHVDFRSFCNGEVVAISFINLVRQSSVSIHFPQLANWHLQDTHLWQCTQWNPPSLQRRRSGQERETLVEGPEQR